MSAAAQTLVLASGSPRRRELLRALGLRFTVRPARIDESSLENEPPDRHVLRLAREKAEAEAHPGELVLGADTVVLLDGEVLGKPADRDDAARMLRRLAGREHRVLTGVALHEPDRGRSADALEISRVRLAGLSDEEIEWYVATDEPLDKAGSYAVQGVGGLFVESVRGNYSNVVGLPLPATYRLFARLGHDLRRFGGRLTAR